MLYLHICVFILLTVQAVTTCLCCSHFQYRWINPGWKSFLLEQRRRV